jgi:hypothetical protein
MKLGEIKNTITSSSKNGFFHLTDAFLDILNTSLPCRKDCPTDMTTLINCDIDAGENILRFGVMARKPSDKLKILKSDSFVLYNTTGIRNCHSVYTGPEFLLLDTVSKCLSPVPKYEISMFIPYTKESIECSKTGFETTEWKSETCSVEHSFLPLQLKIGRESNYLYCYESNITIKNRVFSCPPFPFRLTTMTNFIIGKFVYYSRQQFNQTKKNYIWSESTNKFLSHVKSPSNSSLNEFMREVSQIHIPQMETIETHSKHTVWIVSGTCGTLILIVVVYISFRCNYLRRRNNQFTDFGQRIAFETARQLVSTINSENPPLDSSSVRDIESPD